MYASSCSGALGSNLGMGMRPPASGRGTLPREPRVFSPSPPAPARARDASWARERHGQSAPSPPHRERERPLRARVGEGLPRPVAAQDGLLVDLENHIPCLQPGSVGGAPPDDGGNGGHGRPDAPGGLTTLDLRISKEETKFGGDSFPDHRARHGREPHREEPAPLGAEHRHLALAVRRRRGDEPLEHPRLGDGSLAERDHDVAALEARARSGRSLDDLDDHDAEPFADPVARRDLLHLLLREVPDPDAEPRPLSHVRRRRRRQREGEHPGRERERGAGARDHSRPPSSSLTRSSSAPDKRSSRLVTASVSSSSWRSAASGRTAAAIRSAIAPGGWPSASAVPRRSAGRSSALSNRPHAPRIRSSMGTTSPTGGTSSSRWAVTIR